MNLDTILVPTDFSEDAARALETATGLARTLKSRIVLLHAYTLNLPYGAPPYGDLVRLPESILVEYRAEATRQVERAAKKVGSETGVDIKGDAIEHLPWLAILDAAEKLPADLIVMGTRGRTGVSHITGSTTERVIREARCPVLAVKAK